MRDIKNKGGYITVEEKEFLQEQQYLPDFYFTPIQDVKGNWYLPMEQINKNENIDCWWIKHLEIKQYKPKSNIMTNADKTLLGFTDGYDLLRSMFKYHQINISKILNLAYIMTLILLFTPFLEKYIWSPFWTILFFYAVIMLDFVTAVAASWEEKKFVTQKAIKVPVVIIAYTMLFVILHSMSKVVEAFNLVSVLNPDAFRYLAITTYFLCLFINFLSAIKHMSKLGLIPTAVSKYIERFIDVHKNKMNNDVDDIHKPKNTQENGNNI